MWPYRFGNGFNVGVINKGYGEVSRSHRDTLEGVSILSERIVGRGGDTGDALFCPYRPRQPPTPLTDEVDARGYLYGSEVRDTSTAISI